MVVTGLSGAYAEFADAEQQLSIGEDVFRITYSIMKNLIEVQYY